MKRFLIDSINNDNQTSKFNNQTLKLNEANSLLTSNSPTLHNDAQSSILDNKLETSNNTLQHTLIDIELKKVSILNETQKEFARNYELNKWISNENIIYKFNSNNNVQYNCDNNIFDINEICAFDLDFTVIITKSGKTFPINEDDWKLFHVTKVKELLLQLHNDKKYIVIMSNQGGIKQKKITIEKLQHKIDSILSVIGVPVDFICSIDNDVYRKPCTGMWDFIREGRVPNINYTNSMFIGDAAGRLKEGTRNKDWSDSDYKYALNIGIQFSTPEKFFLGSTQRLHCTLPDPSITSIKLATLEVSDNIDNNIFMLPNNRKDKAELLNNDSIDINKISRTSENGTIASQDILANNGTIASQDILANNGTIASQDITLLVAPPVCGKSTIAKKLEVNGYKRINQDTLGNLVTCLQYAEQYIKEGYSICVDNTNLDPVVRSKWIQLAKQYNIPIRCIILKTCKDICKLLATYRYLDPNTLPSERRYIDMIVIHKYFKDINYPTIQDGYNNIHEINWNPILPTNVQSLKLFHMYLD